MKTANKNLLLGVGLMALGFSVGAQPVLAQGAAPTAAANPAPPLAESVTVTSGAKPVASNTAYLNGPAANPSPTAPAAAPADANTPKTVVAAATSPAVTSPAAADSDVATKSAASLPGADKDKDDEDSEDGKPKTKVPDSVKNVLKTLKVKTEDLTLDDLNAAREAVAKLDALIDIEKRLFELDKVRREREKDNNQGMFGAIPASALGAHAYAQQAIMPPPQPVAAATPAMPIYMQPSTVDVERIEGSNSHYSAFIKEGDTVRQVKIGDKLSDGSVVESISPRGVELKRDKSSHLVQVKDVHTVFGDNP
jgi:hypothetical protein